MYLLDGSEPVPEKSSATAQPSTELVERYLRLFYTDLSEGWVDYSPVSNLSLSEVSSGPNSEKLKAIAMATMTARMPLALRAPRELLDGLSLNLMATAFAKRFPLDVFAVSNSAPGLFFTEISQQRNLFGVRKRDRPLSLAEMLHAVSAAERWKVYHTDGRVDYLRRRRFDFRLDGIAESLTFSIGRDRTEENQVIPITEAHFLNPKSPGLRLLERELNLILDDSGFRTDLVELYEERRSLDALS